MSAGGNSLPLAAAQKLADRIAGALAPWCDHLEVVGSVRRLRPVVTDLDFAALVKPGCLADFKRRVFQNSQPVRDGDEVLGVRLKNGLVVEFYFARHPERDLMGSRPGTLGLVRLIRTGSQEFNIAMCARAKALGLHLNTTFGVYGPKGWHPDLPIDVRANLVAQFRGRGHCLAAETEEQIFRWLKVPFIPPHEREVKGVGK